MLAPPASLCSHPFAPWRRAAPLGASQFHIPTVGILSWKSFPGRALGRQQREPGAQPRDCSAAPSPPSLLKLLRKPLVRAGPARGLCAGGNCCSGVWHSRGASSSPPEPCSSPGSSVPAAQEAWKSHCSHIVPWSTPCASCSGFSSFAV